MKIKSIQRKKIAEKVYNFHCLPDEVYFSKGVLVHNCYKNNQNIPATNMSFETFKTILDKFPLTLTQVAFGITGVETNPNFIKMLTYCRRFKGIIPNFTLSGIDLTEEMAKYCAGIVGALAVSAYQSDKNICYDTVKRFTDLGVKQTNIHLLVSEETLDFVYEVLKDITRDPRLAKLNAVVFLGLKPKGRAKHTFHPVGSEEYRKLVEFCFAKQFSIGFDSCSAPKFEEAVRYLHISDDKKKRLIQHSESCESSLFSSYVNVHGLYWHCSFTEDEPDEEMVDVLKADNFLQDVWYSPEVNRFRSRLITSVKDGCRHCTVFNL